MQKKLFDRLVLSMRQMDAVVAGRRTPPRRFEVQPASIKALRAQTGLSQAKFAELLSVDLGTLRNWEQDRREPLLVMALHVAHALDLTLSDLAGDARKAPQLAPETQTQPEPKPEPSKTKKGKRGASDPKG